MLPKPPLVAHPLAGGHVDHVHLHVNVDHVATLRQARGVAYPDPVEAALTAERAGADGITVHLREDRRHIQESDLERLSASVTTLLNIECAPAPHTLEIVRRAKPHLVTLVPEKREERTTEGGLDVVSHRESVERAVAFLHDHGIAVSLFIDPEEAQIRASAALGVGGVELHTGDYANAERGARLVELERLERAARHAREHAPALHVAAGHGLTVENVEPLIAKVREIHELNIGHALIGDAILFGLPKAVRRFFDAIARGKAAR